jgi:hypothetical protein
MMIIFGLQPFASWAVGVSADKFGIHTVMLVNGSLMVILTSILLTLPSLFKIKIETAEKAKGTHPFLIPVK